MPSSAVVVGSTVPVGSGSAVLVGSTVVASVGPSVMSIASALHQCGRETGCGGRVTTLSSVLCPTGDHPAGGQCSAGSVVIGLATAVVMLTFGHRSALAMELVSPS